MMARKGVLILPEAYRDRMLGPGLNFRTHACLYHHRHREMTKIIMKTRARFI
jgi:hypothetical protein